MLRKIIGWTALILGLLVAGGLALGYTPDTDPAAMRAKYTTAEDRFVDLGGGLTVRVRDTGPRDAPVIVLVHGSNASLETWQPWADRLQRKFRVIRYDQPGHGLTGPSPTRAYAGADMAGILDRLVAKLGVTRFVLAGNSMGGWVAWNYALAHSDKLAGLVLVDASGAPEQGKVDLPIGFRIARTPVLRDIGLIVTPRSVIERSAHQSVSVQSVVTPAMVDRYWEMLRYPGNRQATLDRFSLPRVPITPVEARSLGQVPVLVMWGTEDKLIPIEQGRWFAANIPGAQSAFYPATGHIPMEERPDRSAADVAKFAAGLR